MPKLLQLNFLVICLILSACSALKDYQHPVIRATLEASEASVQRMTQAELSSRVSRKGHRIEQPETCVFLPIKGIALVESVNEKKAVMRFYPGDISFSQPVTSRTLPPDSGSEFFTVHYARKSGPCKDRHFELISLLDY